MADRGGVRIYHPDRSMAGRIVVVPTFREYGRPRRCPVCTTPAAVIVHSRKHYHLTLDGEAATIVSPTVLRQMRKLGMGGFVVDSAVPDPPAVHVGGPPPDPARILLLDDALRGVAPPSIITTAAANGRGVRAGEA